MKRLLSLLLCFVFLNAQSFAKHEMPSVNSTKITGTYGGVLLPRSSTDGAGNTIVTANTLGLFAFIMPQASYGSGATIVFANGRVYSGTIIAMGNPNSLKINAILKASYDFTVSEQAADGTVVSVDVTAQSNGTMDAVVNGAVGGFLPTLTGEAELDVSQGKVDNDLNPIIVESTKFTVDGVQQTTATSLTSTTTGITLPTQ